jgi:hypothetical protein
MRGLRQAFAEDQINLSFPSLRPERFTPEVAHFAKDVRKSGLTLAPEAGSQRLRNVINKTTRMKTSFRLWISLFARMEVDQTLFYDRPSDRGGSRSVRNGGVDSKSV